MMRAIVFIVLLATGFVSAPPLAGNASALDSKCRTLYAQFVDWSSYYKVFAYGESGGSSGCAYKISEQDAIEACTRDLNHPGFKCRIYARSPVKGQTRIVWDNNFKVESVLTEDRSLELLGDKTICSMATKHLGSELVWDYGVGWNVQEAKRRGLEIGVCKNLIDHEMALAKTVAATSRPPIVSSPPSDEVKSVVEKSNVAIGPQRTTLTEDALDTLRKKHHDGIAVIIGNRNYKGRIHEVDFAHNDADAMKRFVLERLGYRDGNVIDLRDASQAQMLAVFGNAQTHEGKLFNWVKSGKSDVVVFYSGHGVPGVRDRRAYLLPVDSDADHAEITGIPIDTLFANLAKIPAKSMTVYLDACFSGESPKGRIIRSTSGVNVMPKMPTSAGNMTVITAARGDQFASWDEKAKHGLFTKHLLEALAGAADEKAYGNADGRVTLAEVQTYLDEEMTYQARRTWGRRQNASVRGDNDTALVYLTSAAMTATARPKPAIVAPVARISKPAIEEMHAIYTVVSTANLRAGPSTNDQIVGGLAADTRIIIDGRVTGKNWYRLDDGSFIFGGLIKAVN